MQVPYSARPCDDARRALKPIQVKPTRDLGLGSVVISGDRLDIAMRPNRRDGVMSAIARVFAALDQRYAKLGLDIVHSLVKMLGRNDKVIKLQITLLWLNMLTVLVCYLHNKRIYRTWVFYTSPPDNEN